MGKHLFSAKKHISALRIYCILTALLFTHVASAQDLPIIQLINDVNRFNSNLSLEKLYFQTDKPNYRLGDTLWFKCYLLDATYLGASAKSGIIYAEIANDSEKVVKRLMLPVVAGITFGQTVLNDQEFRPGGYTLRAYTNWMRNFGDAYVLAGSLGHQRAKIVIEK